MEIRTILDRGFAEHAGERLACDLYLPASGGPHPLLVAVHGGGWRGSSRNAYTYLGPYFAERGFGVMSIDYRLVKGRENRYPAAVHDVRAAVQYAKHHAVDLNVDPQRIGLVGDSAGAHLAALVALAGEQAPFAGGADPAAPYAKESTRVRVVCGFYGVYDLAAQWLHDRTERSDNISEHFLGVALPEDRLRYFQASPLSYATSDNAAAAFFLAWGTDDDIVDPATQSEAFLRALKLAGIYVRTTTVRAGHYWNSDPLDEPQSLSLYVAARMLRFLKERL